MLHVAEEQGRAAVDEQFLDLVGVEGGVEGDGGASGGDDAELGGDPAGMIGGEDGDAGVAGNAGGEPVGDALGHAGKFGEGNAFNGILALNFEGDVVGEVASGFLETLVEGGHGERESY